MTGRRTRCGRGRVRLTGRTPTGIEVVLRPLTVADGPAFQSVRRANAAWLEEWDATSPDPDAPARTFEELVEQYDRDARAGRALPFAVEVDGRFVGQLSVGSVVLGSFRSCYIGYWVSRSVAGQMVIPTALAVAGDYVLGTLRPAPHRGQHPAREHREPGRGAQAGLPQRGAAPALPAHRRRLARPPVLRADHRGPRRRDPRRPAGAHHGDGVRARTRRRSKHSRHNSHLRDTPTGVRRRTATRTYRRNVQSPSSLIFLVLLGVWAAYFVQYWVRRRDHVATARSVEQFSEAMRVLERRDPLPGTDLSEAAPRSYAVHPGRSARPQVLVKRAVAAEPARGRRHRAHRRAPGCRCPRCRVGHPPVPAPRRRPARCVARLPRVPAVDGCAPAVGCVACCCSRPSPSSSSSSRWSPSRGSRCGRSRPRCWPSSGRSSSSAPASAPSRPWCRRTAVARPTSPVVAPRPR